MRSLIAATTILALVVPTALQAQQTQTVSTQPGGVVIMSANKCTFTGLNETKNWLRSTGGPILDDLVKQGRLTGWGVLDHYWGDEWNHVIYYTARDLNTFAAAFEEFLRLATQRDPTILQRAASWCTEHKDNIYRVALTSSAPAR